MLNQVRLGSINPNDIEKIDVNIGVKKLPLVDIDESQNPLSALRNQRDRAASTLKSTRSAGTRSKSYDINNNSLSLTRSTSDNNLKSMVKTFFSYKLDSSCNPTKTFDDGSIGIKNVKSS